MEGKREKEKKETTGERQRKKERKKGN